MTDIDSSTVDAPNQHHDDGPVARPARRRTIEVAVVAVAAALIATVGFAALRPTPDGFCDRVHDLPSIAALGDDGTPSAALEADAAALQQVAASAPDDSTAAAARVLAQHQARLGDAVAGSSSSDDVVAAVASLDSSSVGAAREQLDQAIAQHCG